jgi:hypothetical protein
MDPAVESDTTAVEESSSKVDSPTALFIALKPHSKPRPTEIGQRTGRDFRISFPAIAARTIELDVSYWVWLFSWLTTNDKADGRDTRRSISLQIL